MPLCETVTSGSVRQTLGASVNKEIPPASCDVIGCFNLGMKAYY